MIKNITQDSIIVNHNKICDSELKKTIGLMFHRSIKDTGYIFIFDREVTASIHMFFVFFRIDVIWLDRNRNVVYMKEQIRPFTPHVRPKEKSEFFIELPSGTIRKKEIKRYDKISW